MPLLNHMGTGLKGLRINPNPSPMTLAGGLPAPQPTQATDQSAANMALQAHAKNQQAGIGGPATQASPQQPSQPQQPPQQPASGLQTPAQTMFPKLAALQKVSGSHGTNKDDLHKRAALMLGNVAKPTAKVPQAAISTPATPKVKGVSGSGKMAAAMPGMPGDPSQMTPAAPPAAPADPSMMGQPAPVAPPGAPAGPVDPSQMAGPADPSAAAGGAPMPGVDPSTGQPADPAATPDVPGMTPVDPTQAGTAAVQAPVDPQMHQDMQQLQALEQQPDTNSEELPYAKMVAAFARGLDLESSFKIDPVTAAYADYKAAAQDNSGPRFSATGESTNLSFATKSDHYDKGEAAWDNVRQYFHHKPKRDRRVKTAGIPWSGLMELGGKALGVGERVATNPIGRHVLGAGAGMVGAGIENHVAGDSLPPQLKEINYVLGGLQGMGVASKNPAVRWSTLGSIPMKQMGMFAVGTGTNYLNQQRQLADTNLQAANANLDAAKLNATPNASSEELKGHLNGFLRFIGQNKGKLALGGVAGAAGLYALYRYLNQKPSRPGFGGGGSVTAKKSKPPRVTLRKPGTYLLQYDTDNNPATPVPASEGSIRMKAAAVSRSTVAAVHRNRETRRKVHSLAAMSGLLGLGALGLGAGAVPPPTARAWNDFKHSIDTPADSPAQQMDRYTTSGSEALRGRIMGIPAGVVMQNVRNIPLVPTAVKEQMGSPDHYYNFMRGPYSARMQLYQENAIGDRGVPTMDAHSMQDLEGLYNDWAHDHFGKGVAYLSPEEQAKMIADVRTQYTGDKALLSQHAPEEKMYWGDRGIKALDTAAKVDTDTGPWTEHATKMYTAGVVNPAMASRNAVLRGGLTLGGAGAGGLAGAMLGRLLANRGDNAVTRNNRSRWGTMIGGGLGALAGGAAGYLAAPSAISAFDKLGKDIRFNKIAVNLAPLAKRVGIWKGQQGQQGQQPQQQQPAQPSQPPAQTPSQTSLKPQGTI